ncbi:hypothetical protein [Actinophytocola sp. NPDC049390]|uniref:hypothetical protein n=1 Tax=Actinophytocola sp. NPDC049390 TaxID=3363894 RepID=UPI0037AE6D74
MRDAEHRDDVAAQPLPAQRVPSATDGTEPIPVDEAGLETGDGRATGVAPPPTQDNELFAGDAADRLRARWRELQADFVDDPRGAVREADVVLDEVVRTITEHRARLAGEWQGHTDTEHLRLALREYRSFVDRLLPR